MSAMYTRPIPDFAVKAWRDRCVATALRETGSSSGYPVSGGPASDLVEVGFVPPSGGSQRISPWRLAQDAAAATALAFLVQYPGHVPQVPAVGDFLVVLDDNGVSRAMLDINQFSEQDASHSSRAAVSMQPLDLSRAESTAIQQALTSRSARPKIRIAPLPEYRG